MTRLRPLFLALCTILGAQDPDLESLRKDGHWKQIRTRTAGWVAAKPQDPYALLWSSRVKGAFRDWFYSYYAANRDNNSDNAATQAEELTKKVFGREEGSEGKEGHAGAIALTDARILLFPVRSNVAPFVWVTCPAVLSRLKKDLKLTAVDDDIDDSKGIGKDDCLIVSEGMAASNIILEDLVVKPGTSDAAANALRTLLGKLAPSANRVLVVADENFSFLTRTATEVQAQIAIDIETGTTKTGSLRYQELLPADAVLYTLVFYGDERRNGGTLASVLQKHVKDAIATHVQIGGDMTMGRGIMEVSWFPSDEEVTQ